MSEADHPDSETPPPPEKPVLDYSRGPEPAGGGDGWVHVWKARDPFEANLAVAGLAEHGIAARVDMEHASGLGHWGITGPGGTTVQARRADAQAARKILEEIDARRERRQNADRPACPACGHHPAKRRPHPARVAGFAGLVAGPVLTCTGVTGDWPEAIRLLIMVGLPVAGLVLCFVAVTPRWVCKSCGHRWAAPEPRVKEEDDD